MLKFAGLIMLGFENNRQILLSLVHSEGRAERRNAELARESGSYFNRFDHPRAPLAFFARIAFIKIKLRKSPRTNFKFRQRVHLVRFPAGVRLTKP